VTKPPPSRRRQVLAAQVLSEGLLVDIPCSTYAILESLYRFSPHSIKRADYIRRGIRYNSNFSADDFNHLNIE
jgi:hypothetical protein